MSDTEVTAAAETLRLSSLRERLVAVDSLAEGVSHELHNPLNCASLQLAVLQRRLEQPDCQPATLQPVAELVAQALHRLKVLFDDLVFLLQPAAGAGALLLAAGARWPAHVSLVRAEAHEKGIRVALNVVLVLPPADGRLLSLLLANLSSDLTKTSSSGDEPAGGTAVPPEPAS